MSVRQNTPADQRQEAREPEVTNTNDRANPIVAGLLALGAFAMIGVLVWRPWQDRDAFGYTDIAPVRDDVWLGVLIDGFAFALVAIALSLAICQVVRARGRSFALVGGLIASIGGLAFAMGNFGFAAIGWYATSTEALSVEAGTQLLTYVEDNPGHVFVVGMAGFMLYTIGSLLLAVALLRSRSVSRWLPIGLMVLTAAQFAPVSARVLDAIQIVLLALLVVLAGALGRPSRTS